ncbi:hypothetical protein GCM10028801_27120 [Nocardioides maradonensis]
MLNCLRLGAAVCSLFELYVQENRLDDHLEVRVRVVEPRWLAPRKVAAFYSSVSPPLRFVKARRVPGWLKLAPVHDARWKPDFHAPNSRALLAEFAQSARNAAATGANVSWNWKMPPCPELG